MLEAVDLACVRGRRPLFSRVGFRLATGELLRVTGPNGSGKTSLLRILCGLSSPESGEVRWDGQNTRTLREDFYRNVLYVGHLNGIKDELTAEENLQFWGNLAGRNVSHTLARKSLERVGLRGYGDIPARVMSQGQKRRVALARLVMDLDMPLWVLDEPFTALDVQAVGELKSVIERHLHKGGEVVLTTHQEVPIATPTPERLLTLGAAHS